MKRIWETIENTGLRKANKVRCFLILMTVITSVFGGALWLAAGRFVLPGTEWLLCFIGYPALFAGVIGGIIYIYNHEFT